MNNREILAALDKAYVGLLDPTKKPELVTEKVQVGKFTKKVPTLYVWSYADVLSAMHAKELSRRLTPWFVPLRAFHLGLQGPTTRERGPKHDTMRRLAEGIIGPAALGPHQVEIRRIARDFAQQAGSSFDLATLADWFTYEIVLLLLGVDQDDEMRDPRVRKQFFEWLDEYGQSTSAFTVPHAEDLTKFFTAYFQKQRRTRKKGSPIDELVSTSKLSLAEKIAETFFVFFSATVTTSYEICSAYAQLQTVDPETLARVTSDDRYLRRAVQEALRLRAPNPSRPLQVIKTGFEMAGHRLKKGNMVQICWSSANRDPSVFEDPDQFYPLRHPNNHLAFGAGDYMCPGKATSGEETVALLGELLRRSNPPKVKAITVTPGALLRMKHMQVG